MRPDACDGGGNGRAVRRRLAWLLFAGSLPILAPAALAAESYAACTGFIDALPATVGTAGTWCLRDDLSTSLASGAAITLAAPDITLDCNGFKLGGLGAGPGTEAIGIEATDQGNNTVRRCNVRGFRTGISVSGGGGGHVVEDNRVELSTHIGIQVGGNSSSTLSVVRRNHVLDTGDGADDFYTGIMVYSTGAPTGGGVDVLDNSVNGFNAGSSAQVRGIEVSSDHHALVSGNLVRGDATWAVRVFNAAAVVLRGNRLIGPGTRLASYGLRCVNASQPAEYDGYAKDNMILGFDNGLGCDDVGGNVVEALVITP